MTLKNVPVSKVVRLLAAALVAVLLLTPAVAQQTPQHVGIVSDWSSQHVVFSNPGTFQDAAKNGTVQQWLRIVNDPRYRMQQLKRHAAVAAERSCCRTVLAGNRRRLRSARVMASNY